MSKMLYRRKNRNLEKLRNSCNHSGKAAETALYREKARRDIKSVRSNLLESQIRSPSSYRFLSPLSNSSLRKETFSRSPFASKRISDTFVQEMKPFKELRFCDVPKKSRFSAYVNNTPDTSISRFSNPRSSNKCKKGLLPYEEEEEEDDDEHESTIQKISHYLRESLNRFHEEMVSGLDKSLKKLTKNNSLTSLISKSKTKKSLIFRSSLDSLKTTSELKTILKNNSSAGKKRTVNRDVQAFQVHADDLVDNLKKKPLMRESRSSKWEGSSSEDDSKPSIGAKKQMTSTRDSSTPKPNFYCGFDNSSTSTVTYYNSRQSLLHPKTKKEEKKPKKNKKKKGSDELVQQAKMVLDIQDRIGELQKTQEELVKHHCCFTNLFNQSPYPCFY